MIEPAVPVRPGQPPAPSKLKAWSPFALWAALLFALSSIPGNRIPPVKISLSDKVLHACVYGILGALAFRAVRSTTTLSGRASVVLVAVVVLTYGVLDEIHQMFVPMRSPEIMDVVADLAGGILGATVLHLLTASRRPA